MRGEEGRQKTLSHLDDPDALTRNERRICYSVAGGQGDVWGSAHDPDVSDPAAVGADVASGDQRVAEQARQRLRQAFACAPTCRPVVRGRQS
jgi:hypothetical protein